MVTETEVVNNNYSNFLSSKTRITFINNFYMIHSRIIKEKSFFDEKALCPKLDKELPIVLICPKPHNPGAYTYPTDVLASLGRLCGMAVPAVYRRHKCSVRQAYAFLIRLQSPERYLPVYRSYSQALPLIWRLLQIQALQYWNRHNGHHSNQLGSSSQRPMLCY